MTLPAISVIIRTHKISRLQFLRRALISLAVQQNVCVEIIIATQRFSENDLCLVNNMVSQITTLHSNIIGYKIVKVGDLDQVGDLRVELLNEGLSVAGERYIAFLDDDDLVYHFAYDKLITDLNVTQSAVAFGRCVRVEGEMKNGLFYRNKQN